MKKVIYAILILSIALFAGCVGCDSGTDPDPEPTTIPTATSTPQDVSFQEGVSSYAGTTDAGMHSVNTTYNYGGLDTFNAGWSLGTSSVQRGLIKFDLSSLAAGTVINSAEIVLVFNNVLGDTNLSINKVTKAWDEGISVGVAATDGCTWVNADAGVSDAWTTVGGDYGAQMGTFLITGASYGIGSTITITLNTAQVQSWIDTSSSNHGMIIKATTESGLTHFNVFYTSEAVEANRPKLNLSITGP
jgi:hypothetical protein